MGSYKLIGPYMFFSTDEYQCIHVNEQKRVCMLMDVMASCTDIEKKYWMVYLTRMITYSRNTYDHILGSWNEYRVWWLANVYGFLA
jgi:hypothetical protein